MQKTSETPLVSLVIPVYNAMPYLRETLDALPAQGLDDSQLEVVLVNDGSDDGSETLLAEYASRHANYRLIDQPNSGGPADPCNKGIAAVRGKYFFVLGADDVLTEGALGDLAAYAEKEGSDIVLAKMAGLNGRHAPSSMFRRTVADADIVEDKLYNSLTAIKLFRTDLVAETGAHNPTHLRVGSDQPFTLACYLVAKKISVRADRDFVLIRKREDGKNVTSSARSAWDYAQLLTANIDVIVKFSAPGELRDGILRRPIRGALRKALHPRFLQLDEQKQEAVVAEIAAAVTPVYTEAVAAHLGPLEQVKTRLALDGRTSLLRRLLTWEKGGGKERLTHDATGFHLDLPEDLAQEIDGELLRGVPVTGMVRLEELAVEGAQVRLAGSARVKGCDVPPDAVQLRARKRGTEDWFDVSGSEVREVVRGGDRALEFRADVDAAPLEKGVWDLSVVHRYGSEELVNRLGRLRSQDIAERRHRLLDGTGRKELGLVYFTEGFGNVSLDIGHTLLPRSGPDVRVLTAVCAEPDRRLVLLAAEGADRLRASVHADEAATGGRTVPLVPVGEGVMALSLDGDGGPRWVKVEDGTGHVVLAIPEAVSVPHTPGGGSVLSAAADGGKRTMRAAARRLGVRRPGR